MVIATNDSAASVKRAISHRAGLWDPWSLLAHLDVEPPHLRYAALPRNPTNPLILNLGGWSTRSEGIKFVERH